MEGRVNAALLTFFAATLTIACSHEKQATAPAVRNRDSLPIMSTTGVSKLISDSGVIRYKIIAETWDVYDRTKPQKQVFLNGIFMEKYNEHFKVEMSLTADTAYWYDQNLWELRGRIEIRKSDGLVFKTDELFWDMGKHLVYSHKYVNLQTVKQSLRGVGFRSDEELTNYEVLNSAGSFPMPEGNKQPEDTAASRNPSQGGVTPATPEMLRPAPSPSAKNSPADKVTATVPATTRTTGQSNSGKTTTVIKPVTGFKAQKRKILIPGRK